jgi:MarR-like DNA-binding transcriptional regulator SgrR of sgrS sRNA
MLSELAEPRHSITVQAPDGKWLGTGPFQLEGPESSRPLVFKAFDLYWGGRPFLDFIELETGLAPRDQWMEFELGQADLIEIGPDQFRLASQKQARIWNPSPDQLLALAFGRNCPAVSDLRLREALALSIDRAAIHRVLLQKQGEATAALLPQWLSGYAFLFPAERNLERARLLVSSLPPSQRQLSLVYPAGDSIARLMADRISLNARESGISIRTAAYAFSSSALGPFPCDVAIFCRRIRSFAPGRFLEEMKLLRSAGSAAGVSMPASPLEWHAEEKESLLRLEVIPLFHLAISYGLSRRIHGWPSREEFQPDLWRLENIWVNPGSGTVEKP